MQQLLLDPELRGHLGKAGLASARQRTWDCIFDALIQSYQSVLPAKKEIKTMAG